MVYYFSKLKNSWIRDSDFAELHDFDVKENKKRLKIKVREIEIADYIYDHIYIYADVSDVKLVLNDKTYLLFYETGCCSSMRCVTEDEIMNKSILKNVSEDYTYLKKWVKGYCDIVVEKYKFHDNDAYERALKTAKQRCLNKMTDSQRLYYEVCE